MDVVNIAEKLFLHALTGEGDLFDVLEEISTREIESRYYQMGIGLRLKIEDLKAIEELFHQAPSRALSEVVQTWLQQQYDVKKYGQPTWQMLVKAINSRAGGNDPTLAKTIALNHPAVQEKNLCEGEHHKCIIYCKTKLAHKSFYVHWLQLQSSLNPATSKKCLMRCGIIVPGGSSLA